MATTKKAQATRPTDAEALRQLIERAQNGDTKALPALRKKLEAPALVDQLGGDLAQQAALTLIRATAGKNLVCQEALSRKVELLQAELSGPNPTPLERLLSERIVACWLQVYEADVRFAQANELSLPWDDYYQRRMDRAHKRYLSAIKTLATVRKLALPVLQVSIAKKQLNVAGVCVPGEGAREEV